MTTTTQGRATQGRTGLLSVLSASAAAALAAFTHSNDFGPPAFVAGGVVVNPRREAMAALAAWAAGGSRLDWGARRG